MRTLRKLLRLPSRRTKKSGSRKHVATTPPKPNKKAAIAKYTAITGSEFDGGIVPYMPAATKALTTRIKPKHSGATPMVAKKPSLLTRFFTAKKKPITGGVGYTFNLDCKDGGLMRPEAYSECPPRGGPADPRFFTELY